MSLKEDYSGVCTGGFDSDMATVFQAGFDYVGTQTSPGPAYTAISTALSAAAAAGTKVLTVTTDVTFEPSNLKLNGIHQQTFFAGALDALAHEGIYSMYVSLTLNTSDTAVTKIDFNFVM